MVAGSWRHRIFPVLAALGAAGPVMAQGRDWSPDERAVVGDFTRISAVAVTRDRVFAVAPGALLAWDPQARRWEGPWQPPEPGMLRDVSAALADPIDGSIWLIRGAGWLRFDPAIRFWEQGQVPGSIVDAALDGNAPAAGLYLRAGGGWYLATRGGAALPAGAPLRPIRPASLNDAIRDNPAVQAGNPALLLPLRARGVRYTSAARGEGFTGRGWYLGTVGAGLLFLPEGAVQAELLTFGLPADAVDALFAGPGGVWAVTQRTASADPAVSFVSTRLAEFRWFQGPRASGLPFARARRVVGRGSELWVATDGGVIRLDTRDESVVRYDDGRGIPDPRVLDLAQRRGRLVAGTAHGLAVFTDSGGFRPVAPAFTDAALAVTFGGDSIWVGTPFGLFVAPPGAADLQRPAALGEGLSLQAMVVDLTWRADTLVALLRDRLLWREPASGGFTLGPLLDPALGRLHTVVSGPTGLYVAGDRGVGFVRLGAPVLRTLTVPGVLPAEITDLAVDDDYLWVATLGGLVRLRLDLVGR